MRIIDNNIFFDNNENKRFFFSALRPFGKGHESTVFKYFNKTLKIFNKGYFNEKDFSADVLLKFSNIVIPNVYFPKGLIYCNNNIIGMVSDFAFGDIIENYPFAYMPINDIISSLRILDYSIQELSSNCILVNDVHDQNVVFDDHNFKLIDTSSYTLSELSKEETLRINRDNIYRTILRTIMFGRYSNDYIYNHYGEKISLYLSNDYIENPIIFLEEIKHCTESTNNISINSFNDADFIEENQRVL